MAGRVATEAVSIDDVSVYHGMVEATIHDRKGERCLRDLATLCVLNLSFGETGVLHQYTDSLRGTLLRSSSGDVGLSGIAGVVSIRRADEIVVPGLRFELASAADRTVWALTVTELIKPIGLQAYRHMARELHDIRDR